MITVADIKVATGLAPDAWAHERMVEGYLQVYWPAPMQGRRGWWWVIATPDRRMVAAGWALGSVRDRNADIARSMLPLLAPDGGTAVA